MGRAGSCCRRRCSTAQGAIGEQQQFASVFWDNLREHVDRVCARNAPPVVPSSSASGAFTPGSSIMAVLPDTQVYTLQQPELFDTQTSFIRNNQKRLDIQFVVNLGDSHAEQHRRVEWQRAVSSMSMLNGVVPYAIVPGNHDYWPIGDASTRDTLLNEYFSYESSRRSARSAAPTNRASSTTAITCSRSAAATSYCSRSSGDRATR